MSSTADSKLNPSSTEVLVWITDLHDRCIYANPQAAHYVALGQDIASARWNAMIHADERDHVTATAAEQRSRKQPYQLEYRIRTEDGQTLWKLEAAAPRHSESGDFLGYHFSIADVTSHHLERQRLADNEAKHRFLTSPILLPMERSCTSRHLCSRF
jgi:PAS domain S-box-containing protein